MDVDGDDAALAREGAALCDDHVSRLPREHLPPKQRLCRRFYTKDRDERLPEPLIELRARSRTLLPQLEDSRRWH